MSKGKSKSSSKSSKRPSLGIPHFLTGGPVTTTQGITGDTGMMNAISGKSGSTGTFVDPAMGVAGPLGFIPGVNNVVGQANPIGQIVKGIQNATQNQFQASASPIQAGTTADQLSQAYNTAQGGIGAQQGLVNALAAQNGIVNQSSVYGQQQALANQLGMMAQGQGPNVAQAQLNQTTGQNVANQAALMAGQRGAGANAGLMARQAAQQGAATQQQAVGQAATLRAQQQLGAIGALQQQQQALGSTAGSQVNQLGQAMTGYNTAAQNEQNQLQAANTAYNNALVGQQSNLNNVNAQVSMANQQASNGLLGGAMKAASSVLSMLAEGGEVSAPATDLGKTSYEAPAADSGPRVEATPSAAKDSGGGEELSSGAGGLASSASSMLAGGGMAQQGGNSSAILKENYSGPKSRVGRYFHSFAEGGSVGDVKAMVSPGEIYLSPDQVNKVASGRASPMDGERIPGAPRVGGAKNSYANDTVPKTLKEGGIVLPRSVTKADGDKEAKARKFVDAIIARKGKK